MGLFSDSYDEPTRLFPRERPFGFTSPMEASASQGRASGFYAGSGSSLLYNAPDSNKQKRQHSDIGTGTDYGTAGGRGAAGARFFGEGRIQLKSGSSSDSTYPFYTYVRRGYGGSLEVKVLPGTLNGVLATNYLDAGDPNTSGRLKPSGDICFVIIKASSDGKIVTSFSLEMATQPAKAQAPTSPLAPTAFEWPISLLKKTSTSYSVYPLIGRSSLTAVVRETSRVPKPSSAPSDPGYEVYYSWVVANSVDPIVISINE